MSDNLSKEQGNFHKFHRPEAGSRTVEGNTSGARAMRLERQREAEQAEFERKKREKQLESQHASLNMDSKFQQARIGSVEERAFKAKTIGLVTAEEFAKATNEKEGIFEEREATPEELKAQEKARARKAKQDAKKSKKRKKEKKQRKALLSFDDGNVEDEENEEPMIRIRKKDPTIDTSFLPDKEREEAQAAERVRLEKEWKARQEEIKQEKLQITYSYWDGSGHRRTCTIRKGDTVGDGFLEVVRKDLSKDFRELANVSCDALLYVKEDLILPHDITFYDLIVTKARGKSGPLFHFDVRDDIQVGPTDVRIEKDESHPGKVVERSWYERNKHIFPASRWEVYDPSKNYGAYTIAGKIVTTKTNGHNIFQR